MSDIQGQIIDELKVACSAQMGGNRRKWGEIETVTSDIAMSINPDGVHAEEIPKGHFRRISRNN